MPINFHIATETLSDCSEVSDVWLIQCPGRLAMKFAAVTRADAEALQSGMMELIRKHTNEELSTVD